MYIPSPEIYNNTYESSLKIECNTSTELKSLEDKENQKENQRI